MTDTSLLRALLWCPAIFLASYIVIGWVIAFIVAFWLPLLLGIAILVGLVTFAAWAS